MRVLLIEDDSETAKSINLVLKAEGFNVYTTESGEEGIDLGKNYDYDVILLDLMLPDMSGYRVLHSLRSARIASPILVLSGLVDIEVKLKALRLGADDYLPKPFDNGELVARIRAIVRRSKGHAQSRITVGDLVVDLNAQEAEFRGVPLALTVREYQILELLALRKGSATTRTIIMNNLYGGLDEPEVKIIGVFICNLRRKIADAGGCMNFIESIWGVGYVLRDPADQLVDS